MHFPKLHAQQGTLHVHCCLLSAALPIGKGHSQLQTGKFSTCSVSRYGSSFRLLRLCGGAPKAALQDLASSVIQPADALWAYNPFLSLNSCNSLVAGIRVWMQLCVLEDKLNRICALSMAGEDSKPLLIQVCF